MAFLGVAALVAARLAEMRRGVAARQAIAAKAARTAQPVRTVIAQPEAMAESVVVTGTVRASESVDLHVEIAGKVTRLLLTEGAQAKRGDPLLQVDDSELRGQLVRAEERRNLAALREERLRLLKERGFSNLQDYDTAVTELAVQAAEIALINTQIEKTVVRAPFDGVIGLRSVSEGAYVTPSTPIARLQAIEEIKIDLTLPEKYGSRVQTGQRIEFAVAGVDGTCPAEIYALEPQIDETTRTVLVRARARNPGGRFRPGAFARVTWHAAETPDALLVPAVAVVSNSGEKTLYVASGGRAERRTVVTGQRSAGKVQIVAGLKAGERVIVSGIQSLRPGAAIVDAPP